MYYSQTTLGFYDLEIHGDNIPPDAIEITAEEHAALMAGQEEGKQIVPDADGRPILVEPPPPNLAAQRRAEILAELVILDTASARPLRALVLGAATQADQARLAALDAQASSLRQELVTLG